MKAPGVPVPDPGEADALTMLGRIVHVRPVRPDDEAALRDLHARLSPRNRYLRFFSACASSEVEARRLARRPDSSHLALVVTDAGQVVGVASYERTQPTTADVAVLVDDARQGEGIGMLALEHLAAAARRLHRGRTTRVDRRPVARRSAQVPSPRTRRDIGSRRAPPERRHTGNRRWEL